MLSPKVASKREPKYLLIHINIVFPADYDIEALMDLQAEDRLVEYDRPEPRKVSKVLSFKSS